MCQAIPHLILVTTLTRGESLFYFQRRKLRPSLTYHRCLSTRPHLQALEKCQFLTNMKNSNSLSYFAEWGIEGIREYLLWVWHIHIGEMLTVQAPVPSMHSPIHSMPLGPKVAAQPRTTFPSSPCIEVGPWPWMSLIEFNIFSAQMIRKQVCLLHLFPPFADDSKAPVNGRAKR